MTNDEKEKINYLRQCGAGYGAIAVKLSLSENTVKSYCRRLSLKCSNNGSSDKFKKTKSSCENCGKAIEQAGRHRPRRFCSDSCRREWWRKNEKTSAASSVTIRCSFCGKEFQSRSGSQKYCDHACYIAARFGGDSNDQRAI